MRRRYVVRATPASRPRSFTMTTPTPLPTSEFATSCQATKQFQARDKAFLVDADSHGLELVRYIHLNPVRARLVSDPAHYPYSGHLGYLANAHMAFWPLTGCCRSLTRASA